MRYSVHKVIDENYNRFCTDPYIYEYSAAGFVSHSYKQFADDAHGFAAYLHELGMSNSHIGIYSEKIYVSKHIDCDDIVDQVNSKLPKFSRIKSYDVIVDRIDVRYK